MAPAANIEELHNRLKETMRNGKPTKDEILHKKEIGFVVTLKEQCDSMRTELARLQTDIEYIRRLMSQAQQNKGITCSERRMRALLESSPEGHSELTTSIFNLAVFKETMRMAIHDLMAKSKTADKVDVAKASSGKPVYYTLLKPKMMPLKLNFNSELENVAKLSLWISKDIHDHSPSRRPTRQTHRRGFTHQHSVKAASEPVTPRDTSLLPVPPATTMSSETHDKLKKLISELKDSTAKDDTATPDVEANLFTDLEFVYNSDDGKATQEDLGVVIEQYGDLTQHEQFIQFKRLTAVYERDMYNKFFVPIWAAAMNADKSVGYVLSPKLTPLREVLKDLMESYGTSEVYYDKLNQVLRLCFAPIALAIDALHAPIYNKRMMYHHRDICIDNIYLRVRKSLDSSGQKTVEYDDARLKLTNLTREVLPEDGDKQPLLTEYYHHHADVKYCREPYGRRHDWYSFGIYILEVLHLALPITIQTSFSRIWDYTNVSYVDSWILSSAVDAIRPFLSQYRDIAVKCLKLQPNEHQPLGYEIPDEMKQRFLEPSQSFQMYFEYSVSMWTAQLLWMYEESRPKETPECREDEVCQACLLRSTERISTKQHGRGNQPKCDEDCQHHCLVCYTNEERLFCCKQHGTTGTIVDHRYSYVLILYGQSFENVCKKDTESAVNNPFQKEADTLAKALNSKLICGVPKANIHVRPVYGDGAPEDCLKRHCEEMRELIHGDGSSFCSNDTSYTLFTFYIGHSYHGCDKTVGDWCPTFTHTSDDTFEPLRLKRALVHYHMTSIQKCTNYGTSHPKCQAACLALNYLVNPCGPSPVSTAHQWSADKDIHIGERSQPFVVTTAAPYHVTVWFRQMLQGLFHSQCSGKPRLKDIQKRTSYHSKCKVPLGKIDVCFKLARYIYEELGEAFIDGECLRIHQKHLKTHNGYTELMVHIDDEYCKPVLAYYKPQGVFRKVFSENEGEEPVNIDFSGDITCDQIKEAVLNKIKDREKYKEKTLGLVLRSGNHVEHPIVHEDNINEVAESSALFYHIIPLDDQDGAMRTEMVEQELLQKGLESLLMTYLRNKSQLTAETLQKHLSAVPKADRYRLLTTTNESSQTVCHVAAMRGDTDILNCVISAVTGKQQYKLMIMQDRGENIAIAQAAFSGHADAVTYMLNTCDSKKRFDLLNLKNEDGRSTLHSAAWNGCTGVLNAISGSVTAEQYHNMMMLQDRDGDNVIACAAYNGHTETVSSILNSVDPDKLYELLKTALHRAAQNGHTGVLKAILSNSVAKEQFYNILRLEDSIGYTAIACAAWNGHTETVQYILGIVDSDKIYELLVAQDENGKTALHGAAQNGHIGVLKAILGSVTKEQYHNLLMLDASIGYTVVACAAWNGHTEILQYILNTVADPDRRYEMLKVQNTSKLSILHVAAQNGDTGLLKAIIHSVTDEQKCRLLTLSNDSGQTTLHVALCYGFINVFESIHQCVSSRVWHQLLTKRDNEGDNVLLCAISQSLSELAKYILKSITLDEAFDILKGKDDRLKLPLRVALYKNQADFLKFALGLFTGDQRVDLLKSKSGNNLLFESASRGDTEPVKCLLDAIDIEFRLSLLLSANQDGKTALHLAASRGHVDTVVTVLHSLTVEQINQLLLIKDNNGNTPILDAARNGQIDILKRLFNIDDLNCVYDLLKTQNDIKRTALHLAASDRKLTIFKYELRHCLSAKQWAELLSVKDISGKTADQIALEILHSTPTDETEQDGENIYEDSDIDSGCDIFEVEEVTELISDTDEQMNVDVYQESETTDERLPVLPEESATPQDTDQQIAKPKLNDACDIQLITRDVDSEVGKEKDNLMRISELEAKLEATEQQMKEQMEELRTKHAEELLVEKKKIVELERRLEATERKLSTRADQEYDD